MRKAAEDSGRAVAVLVDLQGPKIRLGKFEDGPHDLAVGDIFKITTEDIPGTKEICSHDVQGPARRRQARRLPADRRRQGPRRGRRDRRHRRHDQGRSSPGRSRTTRASTCPASRSTCPRCPRRTRPTCAGASQLGADLIALSFVRNAARHQARARDHGRGGPPRPGHRQDREAAGRRQPRGDHRRVRRASWSPAATSASSCRSRRCRSCRSARSSSPAAWRSRSSWPRRCSSR